MLTARVHQRKRDGTRPTGAASSNFVVPAICSVSLVLGACLAQLGAGAATKRSVGRKKKFRSVVQQGSSDDEEASELLGRNGRW